MSEQNGKVCSNCRHNIRFAYNNDVTDIRCYCHITKKPIDYVQGMTHWCRHWSKDVNKSRKEKAMEVTRTIQIEVTGIIDSKDIGENTPDTRPTEYLEQSIKELFKDYDQVNVTVKDFIREE